MPEASKAAPAPWWAAALPSTAPAEPIALGAGTSLLTVDLSDGWAPSIFADAGPGDPLEAARPNRYRQTFVALANDRLAAEDAAEASTTHALDPDAPPPPKGVPAPPAPAPPKRRAPEPVRNYLEVFGIPPTLSVLLARIEADAGKSCFASLDRAALAGFEGNVTYQSAKDARREADEVAEDEAWLAAEAETPVDPRAGLRLLRLDRGRARLRAINAAQARLACEGLIGEAQRYTPGVFDRPTHEALARWERKNDVFGWGFLGGETTTALARPPLELHFETFRRILTERVADAAGIIEDGSVPGTRNLIGEHVSALLAALAVKTPEDLAGFLRALGPSRLAQLRVAIAAPPLPAYYAAHMNLEVEIDRGDVYYDLPTELQAQLKAGGKAKVPPAALEQKRERFPSLTLFVRTARERLPLARWRTTIGSWRSEIAADGNVYYKYKNSDVGPRIWKHVVAGPVWVPPDSAPVKDLLTKKVFDLRKGPVDVVNTEIMGPGFHSAYGLVMAIHHKVLPGGALFDNQIRTHGSVDYTSIAQRFSHGCHRLVNTRAVRLFDFVLRHRTHVRQGDSPLGVRRLFTVDGRRYGYELTSRGYYYELKPPLPVEVLEGRIKGRLQQPVTSYVRKPGVVYVQRSVPAAGEGDSISP